MRAVVQRVKRASVSVDNKKISEIEKGLLLLFGVKEDDTQKDLEYIFKKVVNLRVFDDENKVMNRSILDEDLELLVVSQFTLYGDVRKGNRPSYSKAAKFNSGIKFYEDFIEMAKERNIKVKYGSYGADMQVELINDGPVTILLDSERIF